MRALTPTLQFPAALRQQAQGIRAAIFDVDGVLTDGTIYISEAGESLKAFHALDGHGLKLLAQGGITPIVITGRDSPSVRRRLKDLGLVNAVFGVHAKLAAAEPLLAALGAPPPEGPGPAQRPHRRARQADPRRAFACPTRCELGAARRHGRRLAR